MIKKITLNNYRCFNQTEVWFKDLSIIVGKNNAGKSTLIEALRILSIVTARASNSQYVSAPYWTDLGKDVLGISPTIESLDISKRNIFHLYGDPPATITANFEGGASCVIYVGPQGEIFAILFNKDKVNVESKKFAGQLGIRPVNILPQISPLIRNENVIQFKTVQKNLDSYLSSRNFRNQLKYYYAQFPVFKELAERTWSGLKIDDLSNRYSDEGELSLFVRDGFFTAEIGWMGHGLQMWLQTIWFLARCNKDSTVILDEPDVYMHADLQRRLIRLIKNDYKQIMIATHSIEIMAEVEAENILPIDNSKAKITYANKAPIVQKIIDTMGSVHNIEIARIFAHKKFLIVEGDKDDIKLLGILQNKIFPSSLEPFDILPKTYVEGWGGWQRVIGSHKVFKDNKTELTTYCIFDSDYHTEGEKTERLSEAKNLGLNIHIWSKKEIENFLLVPSCILRMIEKNKKTNIHLTLSDVEKKIKDFCMDLKVEVIDNFATEIKDRDRTISVKTANQNARQIVNPVWEDKMTDLVSGKTVISKLSEWTNEIFKFNLSSFKIARELELREIDKEVAQLIKCIESKSDF